MYREEDKEAPGECILVLNLWNHCWTQTTSVLNSTVASIKNRFHFNIFFLKTIFLCEGGGRIIGRPFLFLQTKKLFLQKRIDTFKLKSLTPYILKFWKKIRWWWQYIWFGQISEILRDSSGGPSMGVPTLLNLLYYVVKIYFFFKIQLYTNENEMQFCAQHYDSNIFWTSHFKHTKKCKNLMRNHEKCPNCVLKCKGWNCKRKVFYIWTIPWKGSQHFAILIHAID